MDSGCCGYFLLVIGYKVKVSQVVPYFHGFQVSGFKFDAVMAVHWKLIINYEYSNHFMIYL